MIVCLPLFVVIKLKLKDHNTVIAYILDSNVCCNSCLCYVLGSNFLPSNNLSSKLL